MGKVPDLKPFQTLIQPRPRIADGLRLSESDLKGPTSSTRIWVDDVNSDGKLDIIVGDSVTLIAPAKGLSDEEFKKKLANWQEAVKVASAALRSATADESQRAKASQEFSKLYSQRAEFMHEEMTGLVWLYLQK